MTPSWIFFWVGLAFVVGVGPGSVLTVSPVVWYALMWSAVAALAWSAADRSRLAVAALIAVALFAGMFRVALAVERPQPGLPRLPADNTPHAFRGEVAAEPVRQARSVRFWLRTMSVDEKAEPSSTSLSVIARPWPVVNRGDTVTVYCRLATGPGRGALGAPSAVCLFPEVSVEKPAEQKWFMRYLAGFKEQYVASLQRVFPEPAGGFIAGLLVGGRGVVSETWRGALNATGTTHLVALSGFNVTIIAGFVLLILRWLLLPRRWQAAVVGAVLIVFVVTVGAEASVVRAAIMGMLVVLARQSGRLSVARNAIVATAVVMLLADPTLLVADIGFQLSFLATLGIVYLYPVFEQWTESLPNPLEFKDALLMAIAAEVFVTPFMLSNFGRFSVVAPLVNMLVVPPVPLIMLFGFLGGVGGLMFLPLGQALGLGAWLGATYVLSIIEFFARLSWAAVEVSLSVWLLVLYYVVLGFWLIWYYARRETPLESSSAQ